MYTQGMLEKYTSKGIQVVYKLYTNQVYNLPWVYSVENVYNKYSLVYSAYHAFSEYTRVCALYAQVYKKYA